MFERRNRPNPLAACLNNPLFTWRSGHLTLVKKTLESQTILYDLRRNEGVFNAYVPVAYDLNNFTSAYYDIASNYGATIGKNWITLPNQEEKPILYDSKGDPIRE